MIINTCNAVTRAHFLCCQDLGGNFWIVSILIIFLVACAAPNEELPYQSVSGFGADISCLFSEKELSNPIVIRSLPDFEKHQDCFGNTINFDFTQKTLIGIRLQGSGCDFPQFDIVDIIKDELNHNIIISVEVNEKGNCITLYQSIHWIAVDLVPEQYAVMVDFD